jgi:hypothetical protein
LKKIPLLLFLLAILFYIFYYAFRYHIALWSGVVISFSAVILGILREKRETNRLLSVVLFLFSLRVLFWLSPPNWLFTLETDSSHALQLTYLLKEGGKWIPGQMGIQREVTYSYFPALYLLITPLALISNLELAIIARIVYPVVCGSITVVLYYLIIRRISTDKIAIWASLVYCLNFVFVFFNAGYVHESLGLVFYTLFLWAFFGVYYKNIRDYKMIAISFMACGLTVLTHHWSSYNLLMITTAFFFFPIIYPRFLQLFRHTKHRFLRKPSLTFGKPSLTFVSITYCIIIFWMVFIATNAFSMHITWSFQFLQSILNPFGTVHPQPTLLSYTPIERILVILGTLVLVVLGVTEVLAGFLKTDKFSDQHVLHFWLIICSVYLVLLSYLSPTFFRDIGIDKRSWAFAFFGISPLVARNIVRTMNGAMNTGHIVRMKRTFRWSGQVKILFIIFPLIALILQAPLSVRDPSFFQSSEICYSAATWVKEYLPENIPVALDSFSSAVIQPYGRVEFALPIEKTIEEGLVVYRSENFTYRAPQDARIIVMNKRIFEHYFLYPDVTADSSALDRECNRMFDSPSLAIFTKN